MLRLVCRDQLSKFSCACYRLRFAAQSLATSPDIPDRVLELQANPPKQRRTRPAHQKQQQQQHRWRVSQSADQQEKAEQKQRTVIVAVIGLPNAGKSTLTNRLIGHKISGVSSKRNTTVDPQLGSFNVGNTQVLLYDTPGLVDEPGQGNPAERLRNAWSTAAMADQLLLIVDAERQFRLQEQSLLKLVSQVSEGPPQAMATHWHQPPAILFLNKQDKLAPNIRATVLQQLRQQLCGMMKFQSVFDGAAMRGEGVDALKSFLVKQAQPGSWLMPAGQSHAATPGELAVELVREKLYRRLNQELPYRLTVTEEVVAPLRFKPRVPAEDSGPAATTAAVDGPLETGAVPSAAPAKAAATAAVPGEGSPEGLFIQIRVDVASKGIKSIVVGKGGGVIQKYVAEPTQAELTRILKRPVKLVVGVKIVG